MTGDLRFPAKPEGPTHLEGDVYCFVCGGIAGGMFAWDAREAEE